MFKGIKVLGVVAICAMAAACAQVDDTQFLVTEPISQEPVYTGKYK